MSKLIPCVCPFCVYPYSILCEFQTNLFGDLSFVLQRKSSKDKRGHDASQIRTEPLPMGCRSHQGESTSLPLWSISSASRSIFPPQCSALAKPAFYQPSKELEDRFQRHGQKLQQKSKGPWFTTFVYTLMGPIAVVLMLMFGPCLLTK